MFKPASLKQKEKVMEIMRHRTGKVIAWSDLDTMSSYQAHCIISDWHFKWANWAKKLEELNAKDISTASSVRATAEMA